MAELNGEIHINFFLLFIVVWSSSNSFSIDHNPNSSSTNGIEKCKFNVKSCLKLKGGKQLTETIIVFLIHTQTSIVHL